MLPLEISLKELTVGPTDHRQRPTDTSPKVFPIANLPNEILEFVFLLNATDRKITIRECSSATLASSRVCQSWRSIALQYPALWPPIIDYSRDSFEKVQELVRRSGTGLLDFGDPENCIKFAFTLLRHVTCNRILTLVLDHAPRLQNFHFDVENPAWWQAISKRFLRHPAPNLKFFGVKTVKKGRKFTGTLFANQAPLLRGMQLDVESWIFNFPNSCSFPLTDLRVQVSVLGLESSLPSVEDWLSFLSNLPSLRYIIMLEAIGIQSGPITNSRISTVRLPNLEMLRVRGHFHESVTLINHLSIPPECGLSVQCTDTQLDHSDEISLRTIIEERLKFWEESSTPNRFLAATYSENKVIIGNQDLKNELWDSIASSGFPKSTPSNPVLIICLVPKALNSSVMATLFVLQFYLFKSIFPIITDLKLCLDDIDGEDTEFIRSLAPAFEHFQNLTTLTLVRDSHVHLFPLLQRPSALSPILLPTLRSLQFSIGYFPDGSTSLLRVGSFLQWRKTKKYPISKVKMINCSLNKSFVRSMLNGVQVEMTDTWCLNDRRIEFE